MANNYQLHLNSNRFVDLKNAINIAFNFIDEDTKAEAYYIHPNYGIILFWTKSTSS